MRDVVTDALRCPTCGQYLAVCTCKTRRATCLALPVVLLSVYARPVAGKTLLQDSASASANPSNATQPTLFPQ